MKKLKFFVFIFLSATSFFAPVFFLVFNENFLPEWRLPLKIGSVVILFLYFIISLSIYIIISIKNAIKTGMFQEYSNTTNGEGKYHVERFFQKLMVAKKYGKLVPILGRRFSKFSFFVVPASILAINEIVIDLKIPPPGEVLEKIILKEIEENLPK